MTSGGSKCAKTICSILARDDFLKVSTEFVITLGQVACYNKFSAPFALRSEFVNNKAASLSNAKAETRAIPNLL